MKGQYHFSLDRLPEEIAELRDLGIRFVIPVRRSGRQGQAGDSRLRPGRDYPEGCPRRQGHGSRHVRHHGSVPVRI